MNYHRNSKGRFSRSSKIGLGLVALAAVIIIAHHIYINPALSKELHATNFIPVIPTKAFADVKPEVSLEDRVNALKQKLADEMNACENPSHLLVWHDDNKAGTLPRKDKVSSGDFAFKISTVQRFWKQLHQQDLTDHEALTLSLDPVRSRELAIDAWINIKGSINEWTCATPAMKTRVEDIRFLLGSN